MALSCLFLLSLQCALSSAQQWFGPSNITGYCYYLHGDTQHTFPESKEICAGLDSLLPQLPSDRSQEELDYWIQEADGVLNIDINLGWDSGFWLGYIDDDNPNGNWISMYTGQPLPLDIFWPTEKTVNSYDNFLFTCKYYAWKFGSYWEVPETKEYLVCQRYDALLIYIYVMRPRARPPPEPEISLWGSPNAQAMAFHHRAPGPRSSPMEGCTGTATGAIPTPHRRVNGQNGNW